MIEFGRKHSYLGMQLEFLPGAVCINMQFYIGKILQGFMDSLEDRRTPAKKGIFEVSEESGELDSGE
jgi:hypothetical protein